MLADESSEGGFWRLYMGDGGRAIDGQKLFTPPSLVRPLSKFKEFLNISRCTATLSRQSLPTS